MDKFAKHPTNHRLILGQGEGPHTHLLLSNEDIVLEREAQKKNPEAEEDLDILLKGTGVLRHEEHDVMVFNKDTYLTRYHQQEYDPFQDQMVRAFD